MASILDIHEICMYFGGVHAVEKLSTYLDEGEILGIIGPNGSGKTTLVNVLTGIYLPQSGEVIYDGKNIIGMKPHEISKLGISRTFQNLRLFNSMTSLQNVITAAFKETQSSMLASMMNIKSYRDEEKRLEEKAREILEFVGLSGKTDEIAQGMAYGEQKRLEFARVIASNARICILDEPAAGLNSVEANDMMKMIQRIRKEKRISIILIDHNMDFIMSTVDRIVVMNYGSKIAEGNPSAIQKNKEVIRVYLG